MQRVILHLDMDAFYAAVEVREDPSLTGKPLIIGHRGRRGVVSTCSYEARKFGVRSAMPSVTAERLCPDAVWLSGRMGLYSEVSKRIRAIMRDATPVVEPISIDEAFLDMTGHSHDLREGAMAARQLKQRIKQEERLTASVGVAPNKFLAKLASDMDKPDGLTLLPITAVPVKLWPLPVERLWGVGPKTAERLRGAGLSTVKSLLDVDERSLAQVVSPSMAAHLRALARGEDDRPVCTEREAKSISEERTYGEDLMDPDVIDRALLARAEGVARALRKQKLIATTVHIKVRTGDFTTWTRALKLPAPTALPEPLLEGARTLFRERIDLGGKGVRLLGLGVSGLAPETSAQATLFVPAEEEAARRRAQVTDLIREKLGDQAITRARLVKKKDRPEPEEASSLPSVD